jgi:hypothetical protein
VKKSRPLETGGKKRSGVPCAAHLQGQCKHTRRPRRGGEKPARGGAASAVGRSRALCSEALEGLHDGGQHGDIGPRLGRGAGWGGVGWGGVGCVRGVASDVLAWRLETNGTPRPGPAASAAPVLGAETRAGGPARQRPRPAPFGFTCTQYSASCRGLSRVVLIITCMPRRQGRAGEHGRPARAVGAAMTGYGPGNPTLTPPPCPALPPFPPPPMPLP